MATALHAQKPSRPRLWVVMAACAGAVVVVASSVVVIAHVHGSSAAASTAGPPAPLTVLSTAPTGDSAASGSTVSVQFSTDLAADSPMPSLTPAVAGAWAVLSPSLLQYQASGPLVPGTTETITVPGGPAGVVGSQGQHLPSTVTTDFTVAPGSTLRLQQLLAELGYLPVTFTASSAQTSPAQEADVQAGNFTWRWFNQPVELTSLWTPGSENVITQGAVMNFESQHGLKTDGAAGPAVWSDLLSDAQSGRADALPYDYVLVTKALPETATVYGSGVPVYATLANTGVAGAPTEDGTWPVYARYTVTTMSGTNPDGSHYVDPGIPWVSYFHGGDALHGFDRGSYGYPQSDGCVEMPPAHAEVVFPLTPLGTLVTVQ
jgi:peptidoglycan hydrolase-like protein with peptidoglycan-binding domain